MPNLVVQTAFLGDLFLSIPLLKQIKKEYPKEPLYLFCRKGFGQVFKQLKLIDDYVEVDKNNKESWKSSFQQLKNTEYENIFCPHQSFRSTMLVNRLKAKSKLGFSNWWNFFVFNERVERVMDWPDALRQLSLLSPKSEGIKNNLKDLSDKKLFLNKNTKRELRLEIPNFASMYVKDRLPQKSEAAGLLKSATDFMCIAPGSIWPTKKWPQEKYKLLAQKVSEMGHKVVIIGSEEEAELGEATIAGINGAINLCGKTDLLGSLQVLSQAKLLVSNDSGAQHLAAAVGTPTVSIFGPTTLSLGYRPWHNRSEVVETILSCRPCGTHGAKKCPLGTHVCMNNIEVDHVIVGIKRIMKGLSH